MTQTMKGFLLAILLTVLDGAVVAYYGPAIWQAWAVVPPIRVLLLLVAGIGSFTLGDIWARIFAFHSIRTRQHAFSEAQRSAPATADLMEGADV